MKHPILKQAAIALAVLAGLSGGLALAPAANVSAKNSTDTSTCVWREYRNGDLGQKCVGYLQTMLNKANKAGLKVDNDYGPQTAEAVKAWQKKVNSTYSNATLYVDGIAGPQTWGSLCLQRAQYKSIAKTAGCDRWNDEIKAYLAALNKTAKTTSAKKSKTTTKACDEQIFSRTKSNRNSVCVHYIQNMLNIAQNTTIDTTAAFGSNTRAAVKAFQTNAHVTGDARGVVGKKTWAALCTYQTGNSNTQAAYNKLKAKSGCGLE
jgi:peptidoglycan hydrolase-like protein with peptidoglycan-binding domain